MKLLRVVGAIGIAGLVACGGSQDDSSTSTATFPPTTDLQPVDDSSPEAVGDVVETPGASVAPSTDEVVDPPDEVVDPPEPPEPQWPPSQDLLDEAVLPISAMPTGWARVPESEPSDRACDISLGSVLGVEDIPTGRAEFAEDPDLGPLVVLSVGVLPPDVGNVDVLSSMRDAMLDCEGTLDEADFSFSELSFPAIGDQSFAVRMNVETGGSSFAMDIVQARVGNVVVQVAGAAVFGDSTAILRQFAEPQLERALAVLSDHAA